MNHIVALYAQLSPPDDILKLIIKIPLWPKLEAQRELAKLLTSEHIVQFPPPTKWRNHFCKIIEQNIGSLDGTEELFDDSLMEYIVHSKSCSIDTDDIGYISFYNNNFSHFVPLRIMRSHNQVGTKAWGAGIYLGELFSCRSFKLFANRTIIELGAGVGITSILIASIEQFVNRPKKLILTDFHSDVVLNLQHNIHLFHNRCIDSGCHLESDILNWSTVSENDFISYGADVLLAADCTYSEDCNVFLVRAFKKFLYGASKMPRLSKNTIFTENNNIMGQSLDDAENLINSSYLGQILLEKNIPCIIVACTVRNMVTFNHFSQLVYSDEHMHCEDISDWAAKTIHCNRNANNFSPLYYYPEGTENIKVFCIHLV